MNTRSLLSSLVLATCGLPSAHAADFPLSFTADGDSRWYEFNENVFSQLDRPWTAPGQHHFFNIAAEADPFNPSVYQSVGNDTVFPNGAAFADIGILSYNGNGDGAFPITEVLLNVYPHVAPDLGVLATDYRTTVLNPVGTVTVAGGVVIDIQLAADIRFEYNVFYIPSLGWTPFDGTMLIDGDDYQIFVDDTYTYSHGQLHFAWDLSGTVDDVGGNDVIFDSGFE